MPTESWGSWCIMRLTDYPGAGPASECRAERLRAGDERLAAAAFNELEASLNLGEHRAGLEMIFPHIPPGFGCCYQIKRLFVRLAVVEAGLVHRGGNDQHVGRNRLRQDGRGKVFVDYGSRSAQIAFFVLHHRNAAATCRNDHVTVLDEMFDDLRFDN